MAALFSWRGTFLRRAGACVAEEAKAATGRWRQIAEQSGGSSPPITVPFPSRSRPDCGYAGANAGSGSAPNCCSIRIMSNEPRNSTIFPSAMR
jgi:hypothetical protein